MSKKIFGWLSPSGEFIECEMYEHLEVASENLEMRSIPKINQIISRLEAIHEECERAAEKEGSCHAEWHTYEMACDDVKTEIVKHLYRAKYIRVGESADEVLHFEGFPDVLRARHQKCVDFAESYGTVTKFDPIRF